VSFLLFMLVVLHGFCLVNIPPLLLGAYSCLRQHCGICQIFCAVSPQHRITNMPCACCGISEWTQTLQFKVLINIPIVLTVYLSVNLQLFVKQTRKQIVNWIIHRKCQTVLHKLIFLSTVIVYSLQSVNYRPVFVSVISVLLWCSVVWYLFLFMINWCVPFSFSAFTWVCIRTLPHFIVIIVFINTGV